MWMPLKRLGTSCLTPRTANQEIYIYFFFRHFFAPGEGAKYGHFWDVSSSKNVEEIEEKH